MIRNDEQLAVVREQLGRVERALDSLRADVEPKNPRNFAILAEAYVDQIRELNAEIQEYLQRPTALSPEASVPQAATGNQPTRVS
jgi:hypothetical protein